ncbi:MAG: 50S ribosomal protein L5 [Candidatus Magasanikbacteria bacterium]|nr:50S ribosomal protein L5 [Candidatus Magasanikbacteria bacterium]
MKSSLYQLYKTQVVPKLKEKMGYTNVMQIPRITKVVLNVGYGKRAKENAFIERVEETLRRISGQKPVRNKAKKSISNFKLREGTEIGSSVTVRGEHMYDFMYKLIHLTLPRVRDFRGLNPKSFDGKGNYTIGFKEHLAFPEIGGDSADQIHGLEMTISTTATTNEEGRALLEELGFPFRKK